MLIFREVDSNTCVISILITLAITPVPPEEAEKFYFLMPKMLVGVIKYLLIS